MSRVPTLARAAAAGGLTALLLTGCGDSQVRTGAAAVVGDTKITTTALQEAVDRSLADPQAAQQLGADRPTFQRQTLNRLVRRQVLTAAADERGVQVDQGRVDARLDQFAQQAGGRVELEKQAAQNGIPAADLPTFIRDLVVEEELGDRLTADINVPAATLRTLYQQNIAQYDQVRSAHILVKDPAQAQRILTQVKADPTKFAALAARFSTDTGNKDRGGDLGAAGRGQFVPAFEKALFAAKADTYFVVKTEFGNHVVHAIDRRTTTLAQATPELRRAALEQQRTTLVGTALADKAKQLGVTVNPRFGRWDPATTTVVDAPDGKNGVTTPAPSGGASAAPEGAPGAPGAPAPEDVAPQDGELEDVAPQDGEPEGVAPEQDQPPAGTAPTGPPAG